MSEHIENQLDLPKLKQLIKKGFSAIPKEESASEAIMVIGDTGVGKSTIMNFLAGNRLVVKVQGLKPKLIVEGESDIVIGHEKYSETSIPTRTIIQDYAFYDCPGFRDNKGEEYEISNSFFVQRLLDIYSKVKIVLMIDETHITETRADKLPRLTKNLLRSFKSFGDIKEGVIMIINKADRDLGLENYCAEIKRMAQLRNERGALFGEEEQAFLNYLVDNKRIKLFKMPTKKDKDKPFEPTQFEKDIMPSIRSSDFVKSRHILNIVSESAKIAIRDFIDGLTLRTDAKVEKIAAEITQKVVQRFSEAGKNINSLIEIKQDVMDLAEEVKTQNGQNILGIIRGQLPNCDLRDFQQDFESVMFFKGIYNKTETYFSNLINKTYSQLTQVLNKMDIKIIRLQKEEQEELERRQLLLRKKYLQNQRGWEQLETNKQIKQINELRGQISEMSRSSHAMIQSMGDSLGMLDALEREFTDLKEQAGRIKLANQELNQQFHSFSEVYIKRETVKA